MGIRPLLVGGLVAVLVSPSAGVAAAAEPQRRQPVPRPFPRPGDVDREVAAPPVERRAPRDPAPAPANAAPGEPTEESLGLPIYPTAQFITSYDAGRGQRFYLFGTNSSFEEMVGYYRIVLDEGGDRVFDAPATHIFEVGRFREREMAFPPSVTVKDYTWDGSDGYLNPTGGEPPRFRTVLQLVPPPPGQERR